MTGETRRGVLERSLEAIRARAIPFAVIGSIAASLHRAPDWPGSGEDIDLFVRPEDAPGALESFVARGFSVERTFPTWLYKARADGVTVDLIFEITGGVRLDREMLERVCVVRFDGLVLPLLSREDLIVTELAPFGPETTSLWFDALDTLRAPGIDWEYLVRRAGPVRGRMLALLAFARGEGIPVPDDAGRRLAADVFGER